MSEPIVGQVWQHKGDPWRRVTITHVDPPHPNQWEPERTVPGRVGVKRNTSRRKQAISFETLHRSYTLAKEAPAAGACDPTGGRDE